MAEGDTPTCTSIELGPTVQQFWDTCVLSDHRDLHVLYTAAISSSAVFALLILWFGVKHTSDINNAPVSKQANYYLYITRMPLVFGLTSFLSILSPRSAVLWEFIQKGYEAYTLQSFGRLLFNLLAIEHAHREANATGDGNKPLILTRKRSVVARTVDAFWKESEQKPKKYWAVPPVGCCCYYCMTPRAFTTRDMLCIVNCLRQFVVAVPCFALMQIWAVVALPEHVHNVSICVKIGQILSAFVALQGLFTLYKATHDMLHEWSTTRKFVAIKLIIIVEMWQKLIISKVVKHKDSSEVGNEGCLLMGEHRVAFWGMWWLVPESLLMLYLMRKAFPASELHSNAISEQDADFDLTENDIMGYVRTEASRNVNLA